MTKRLIIKLLKKYYPEYRQICSYTGEKPCIYNWAVWMENQDLLPVFMTNKIHELDNIEIINTIRDTQIAEKSLQTRKQNQLEMIIR